MEENKYVYIDGKKTRIINLINKRFGKLVVVGFDEKSYKEDLVKKNNKEINKTYPKWLCKCDCGNDNTIVMGINLKNGNTQSCGCLADKSLQLTGLKFGRLTIIERDYIKEQEVKNSRAYWKCECECGNTISTTSNKLVSGHTQSCGCLRKENVSKSLTKKAIIENGSFGEWVNRNISEDFIDLYWSKTNTVSPYEIASMGNIFKVNIICDICGDEYAVCPNHFVSHGSRCPNCSKSKGELKISEILNTYNVSYNLQQPFDGLIGLGNGLLTYDFYLKDKYNLLIEYQGEQHDHYIEVFHRTYADFERQQEHDKRKRQYAKDNNINLLEIWYWDFENIEEILKKELNIN
ncbi:MAG: hypothetical protein PHP29_08385 [Tissierellia bacterium]|nr:hypothetical protein [Tissierellia bacterium]